MPSFLYTARDSAGTLSTGTMAADSIAAVTQKLRGEGRYPTSVKPAEASTTVVAVGADVKVRRSTVIQIVSQLTVMIETGVTISEALDSIAAQLDKPNERRLVEDLARQVKAGSDLSSALARHPRSFPHLFVALIRASEKSGMLARLMARGMQYMRDEQEILRKVRGALMYPAVMFVFSLVTVLFLLIAVLPRFTAIYATKSAILPAPTRLLMGCSTFVVNHYVALPAVLISVAFAAVLYARTQSGRLVWHYAQLRVPLLGGVYRKLHLARGLRMVGTMAGAGVNLLDCVHTAQHLSENHYFRELYEGIADQIQAGRHFSEPLFRSPLVPRSYAQMLHSAEKGGKLAQVMEQVSAHAEQELKEKLMELTRYIEPLMIVIMGILIGGVAMALLLPIFSISKVVAQ